MIRVDVFARIRTCVFSRLISERERFHIGYEILPRIRRESQINIGRWQKAFKILVNGNSQVFGVRFDQSDRFRRNFQCPVHNAEIVSCTLTYCQ